MGQGRGQSWPMDLDHEPTADGVKRVADEARHDGNALGDAPFQEECSEAGGCGGVPEETLCDGGGGGLTLRATPHFCGLFGDIIDNTFWGSFVFQDPRCLKLKKN